MLDFSLISKYDIFVRRQRTCFKKILVLGFELFVSDVISGVGF